MLDIYIDIHMCMKFSPHEKNIRRVTAITWWFFCLYILFSYITVNRKGLLWPSLVISVALNIVANHWVENGKINVPAHKVNHSSRETISSISCLDYVVDSSNGAKWSHATDITNMGQINFYFLACYMRVARKLWKHWIRWCHFLCSIPTLSE